MDDTLQSLLRTIETLQARGRSAEQAEQAERILQAEREAILRTLQSQLSDLAVLDSVLKAEIASSLVCITKGKAALDEQQRCDNDDNSVASTEATKYALTSPPVALGLLLCTTTEERK